MLVTLRHATGIALDIDATPTWEASGGQAVGSARLRIPRESLAWNEDIISEHGGFLVDIESPVGLWRGIADSPVFSPAGMEIRAQHVMIWAGIRHVSTTRRFSGLTPGAIVKRAVQDALVGLGSVPITVGPVLEAAPVIADYQFKGQSLLSVLTDMQNQSGQVWLIDNQLRFHWRQQTGRYHEFTLIDDGKYLTSLQRSQLSDQYAEDIEVEGSGRTFTARNPDAPALWPSQRITRIT